MAFPTNPTEEQIYNGYIFRSEKWETFTSENWHYVTSFTNGWRNFGEVFTSARYRKTINNNVELRGCVSYGTANTVVFTLPEGYRPLKETRIAAGKTSYSCNQVTIYPDGRVIFYSNSNQDSWLDGVCFSLD